MDTKQTFPKTLIAAIAEYSNEDHAHQTMAQLRWPNGVVCPHCGATGAKYLAKYRRWECTNKHPRRQFTVKVGTVFEDSPIAIGKWLMVIWMLTADKNGISSYEIHRAIGVTQKTAWFMMHRVRLALKDGMETKLNGTVEGDETYVGGLVKNMHKNKRPMWCAGGKGKAIVQGLLQRTSGDKPSQVRATVIEKSRRPHIQDTVKKNVEPGSFLMTDSLGSYKGLESDYIHMAINHVKTYAEGRVHTNGMENFWALVSRILHGTYVACEPFHLERYLDEQCFRFNTRKLTDGERFVKALGGVTGRRLTYKDLTGKADAVLPPVS